MWTSRHDDSGVKVMIYVEAIGEARRNGDPSRRWQMYKEQQLKS